MRYDHFTMLPEASFQPEGRRLSRLWGKGGSAPKTPDYIGAAKATAQGNLDLLNAQTAANRVNQVTPTGSLTYSYQPSTTTSRIFDQAAYNRDLQTYQNSVADGGGGGGGKFGNFGAAAGGAPLKAPDPNNYYHNVSSSNGGQWTATQSLTPAQQAILNKQQMLSQGLLDTAQAGLPAIRNLLANPTIDQSRLPTSMINPGQTYIDAAQKLMQPVFAQQQQGLNAQLANQGIGLGSQAYSYAQRDLADQQNRANLEAVMQGIGQNQAARSQELQNQIALKNEPLNIFNALRTGNGVTAPNYANVPQQGYTGGADYLGATQAGYQGALNAYNAQVGAQNSQLSGLMGLGQAAMMSPNGTFSGIGNWLSGLGGAGTGGAAGTANLAASTPSAYSSAAMFGSSTPALGSGTYDLGGASGAGAWGDFMTGADTAASAAATDAALASGTEVSMADVLPYLALA